MLSTFIQILLLLAIPRHSICTSGDTAGPGVIHARLSTSDLPAPYWPYRSFITEPDFHPPQISITKQPSATQGLVFLAQVPFVANYDPRTPGGLVVDEQGDPVYYNPITFTHRIQQLDEQNVYIYWTGGVAGNLIDGHGMGAVYILNQNYSQIATIALNDGTFVAGDSKQNQPYPSYVDLHEAQITPRGTIIVTAYNSTPSDLSSVGGPRQGWILDSQIYEIDIKTNKTLFRWSSIEHVHQLPLNRSHQLNPDGSIRNGKNATHPWDYLLTNSVAPLEPYDEGYLLSIRHSWDIVALNKNGSVKWILNGLDGGDFQSQDQNSFGLRWQHHVRSVREERRGEELVLTVFDNHNNAFDNGTAQTTALTLALNTNTRVVRTVSSLYDPQDTIWALSQGSVQTLANGHTFVGYGQIPKLKEFDSQGKAVMVLRFGNDNQVGSYRSWLETGWSATPYWNPKFELAISSRDRYAVVMSWNGATADVCDGWIIYVGEERDALVPFASLRRQGYESTHETPFAVGSLGWLYLQVAAVNGIGNGVDGEPTEVRRSDVMDVKKRLEIDTLPSLSVTAIATNFPTSP